MKRLFKTPRATVITIATILALIMVIIPPTCDYSEYGYHFTGYRIFAIDNLISRHRLSYDAVDTGRLFLQLFALGAISSIVYRIIPTQQMSSSR